MAEVDKTQMAAELVKQSEKLREEMMEIERNFNMKKEQFIKIQGALETLSLLGTEIPPMNPVSSSEEDKS